MNELGQIVDKAISIFHKIENTILRAGLGFVALAIFLQVIFRYLVRSMPQGLEEASIVLAAWMYFIAIAVQSRYGTHIKVTLLHFKNPAVRRIQNIIIHSLSTLLFGFMTYTAIRHAVFIGQRGITLQTWEISGLVFYLSMVVGFTLSTLYLFAKLIITIRDTDYQGEEVDV
jgi:TRAP-type C4-dicarboxylate transport system permease small subunit